VPWPSSADLRAGHVALRLETLASLQSDEGLAPRVVVGQDVVGVVGGRGGASLRSAK
jgi:hypothetical protein